VTTQVEAPPTGLQWLQQTLGELRDQVESLRKQCVGNRMKIAALEADVEIRAKREVELTAQLQEAESMLDGSSAQLREGIRADILSDIELLSARDRAVASCLVILAAKVVGAGQDSLARMGLPDHVVRTVRGLVFGFADAPPPVAFADGGSGLRYTPPPVTAQEPAPQSRSSTHYFPMSGEEYAKVQLREELLARERDSAALMPRRATDRPTS
jgi:hypothetical protein